MATRYQPKSAEPYAAEDRGFSSPCWIWLRGISDTGYGTARLNGRVMGAHRAYYIERHGPIPEGLHLDHLCRVRACVNPDHLEPVTPAVNAERGTGKTLTPEQIAEGARLRHEEGATFVELGERFGVHPATMLRAIRRYGTGRAA